MAEAGEGGNARSDAEGAAAPSGAPATFFKRRVARGNLRRRDDEEEEGVDGGEGPAVVRPSKAPRFGAAVGGSSAAPRDPADARAFAVGYEADRRRQEAGDGGATAALESETAHDRDARAAREAVLAQAARLGPGGAEVDDGKYHGANAYIDYRKGFRREHTVGAEKGTGSHGPLRAPTNVRFTFIMDYKPDVCKDYKETGFCGYGDSCKFMHDRGDYKAGFQLDKEWEEKQRAKREAEERALAGMLGDAGEAAAEEAPADNLPLACAACRRPWAEVSDPVVTRCKHYFCEQCALTAHAKTKACALCNVRPRSPRSQRRSSPAPSPRSNRRAACSTRRARF